MKKLLNISLLALLALAPACSKDDVFDSKTAGETGSFSTRGLMLEFRNEEKVIRNTRAEGGNVDLGLGLNVEDFNIDIISATTGETVESHLYKNLPEVLTLPVGDYTLRASYGENIPAAWENPYFEGTGSFSIAKDAITEAETVTCGFSNIKVTVDFDPVLKENMEDAAVAVKVGDGAELTFGKDTEGKGGYFAYIEGSTTLAAEFDGLVQGFRTSETKLFNDVKAGNYYKITFQLHTVNGDDLGSATGDVVVDASVEVIGLDADFDIDDSFLDDDRFPTPGEDPVTPDDPVNPNQPEAGPAVESNTPGMEMDVPFDITGYTGDVSFVITSETGIQELLVDIVSTTLTADELESAGFPTTHLNLGNPGVVDGVDMAEIIGGLGFPTGSEVVGQKRVVCTISGGPEGFVPLLTALGPGTHNFYITVKDASGTRKSTLMLFNVE